MRVQTQWRSGMGGPTGLDYAAVRAWLDEATDLQGDERREVWSCIQAAERGSLEGWAVRRQIEDARRDQQQPPHQRPPGR